MDSIDLEDQLLEGLLDLALIVAPTGPDQTRRFAVHAR